MINTQPIILQVRNKEILKQIFSHLETVRIVKLIKYNKAIQNGMEITRKILKDNSDIPRYEYEITSKIVKYRDRQNNKYNRKSLSYNSFSAGLIIFYLLIYVYFLVSNDLLDENNIEDKYDKGFLEKIDFLNIFIFILIGVIIFNYFISTFYICRNLRYDFGCKKYLKIILITFFYIAHIWFEILFIWKLLLSYEIKNILNSLFFYLDYTLIIIHFLYIIYISFAIFFFFKFSGKNIRKTSELSLISYNKIKIKNFELPEEFQSFNRSKRKKFISEKVVNFEYEMSKEQRDLIDLINSYRQKLKLNRYKFIKIPKIPQDMLNLPSEAIFFDYKNIFKVGHNKYIIKYSVGEFKKKLIHENEDIMKIISKDNLNRIHMINREKENEYIYLWEEDDSPKSPKSFKSFSFFSDDSENTFHYSR